MAKRKSKKELKDTKLAVKVESFTVEGLIDHYVSLRFQYWDGSDRVDGKLKYMVFEYLPSDMTNKSVTKNTHKFSSPEEALAFLAEMKDRTKETILASILGVLDGDFATAGEGISPVRFGGENEAERNRVLAAGEE